MPDNNYKNPFRSFFSRLKNKIKEFFESINDSLSSIMDRIAGGKEFVNKKFDLENKLDQVRKIEDQVTKKEKANNERNNDEEIMTVEKEFAAVIRNAQNEFNKTSELPAGEKLATLEAQKKYINECLDKIVGDQYADKDGNTKPLSDRLQSFVSAMNDLKCQIDERIEIAKANIDKSNTESIDFIKNLRNRAKSQPSVTDKATMLMKLVKTIDLKKENLEYEMDIKSKDGILSPERAKLLSDSINFMEKERISVIEQVKETFEKEICGTMFRPEEQEKIKADFYEFYNKLEEKYKKEFHNIVEQLGPPDKEKETAEKNKEEKESSKEDDREEPER
jgi:Rad3-related DNA helicase